MELHVVFFQKDIVCVNLWITFETKQTNKHMQIKKKSDYRVL